MHVSRRWHPFVCSVSHSTTLFCSTLTANIRTRRGSKVAINLPVFVDERTPRPFVDPTIPWDRAVFPEDAGALRALAGYQEG